MAPRRKKTPSSTPVDAIVHGDTRINIPTADAQEFITPEAEQPVTLLYPRDSSLDPQLVWKGKDEADRSDLEVPAPPIFIQEKIDPRVLVENLRRTAKAGEQEPELTLFDTFDGLNELDLVDFYRHQANWSNRMILGDSLQVMGSLAEREHLRGKVQMIFLDPPYGIKFGSNWQVSTRKRDVKDGKLDDATIEVEQVKAFRDTWELGIHSYLGYLRDRLVVARDLLTESGSVFVQIGDENVHLVRSLLDEVFGSENFVSQITLRKTGGTTGELLQGTADFVLWYAQERSRAKYRPLYRTRTEAESIAMGYNLAEEVDSGRRRRIGLDDTTPNGGLVGGLRPYQLTILTSPRVRAARTGYFAIEHEGVEYLPTAGEWKTSQGGVERLKAAGRLQRSGSTLRYVRYADDFAATAVNNVWVDLGGAAGPIYVVQTNTKVIERCMLMCTDPGDLVLDPTCGSGTTAYVAEQWGRRWITIDTSRVALALARQRLIGAKYPWHLLADTPEGRAKEAELTATPPPTDPTTGDIRRGFVYERVQHITLKSIANNPDIRESMTRDEIDAAIKRHADFEVLYDKPYEDKRKVRVTGPFTVESLSPHRSLAFAEKPPEGPTAAETAREASAGGGDFETMILENLARAGIQNGRRNERLTFDTVESYPGVYVQAIGTRAGTTDVQSRVGIALGPQYGTVGPKFIRDAAKEALRADGVDLLVVLGFAFDPQALGTDDEYISSDAGFEVGAERNLGRLPVLLVRMNNDLVMGDELKKTGSGNLFTVFGEPDIEIRTLDDDQIEVEIHGVDVYDPTTGEVRSRDTDHIAIWLVDTDYDEDSFFVRHCYFTGGNDPYQRLKRALKADIDEEAWNTLYRTVSRPFAKPSSGKIAVKVINDYGDEVVQVYDVT